MRIVRQFRQASLFFIFFLWLDFLILLNEGIRHVNQESIGFVEESFPFWFVLDTA